MIYLGLGSNLGDRESFLRQAVALLQAHPDIHIVKKSAIYETEPFGYIDQENFLNAVIGIESSLSPLELLQVCLETEKQLGRVREQRWGPRTIDIDILLFDDQQICHEQLTVPHPFLRIRPFVLIPLRDLTLDEIILDGLTVNDLLETCESGVVRYYQSFD